MIVAALLVARGTLQDASGQPANDLLAVQPGANTEAVTQAATDQETALGEQTEDADLAEAATKPISTEKPLPPSIKPGGPLAEVIKLAGSGVEESVIMAFVTNSPSPFNLGVEEIIYLNDIGVSGSVVTAMMQRDQALKGLSANTRPQYAPEPATAPTPPEVVPEAPSPADYTAENYPPPPADDTGYSTFYDSLAPYGTWVDVAGYGPCWQPTVVVANPTWRPYCDSGRWVYTDCGWYWMSGYSWGWAPFHYGRWFQHHRLGWCWAPDKVWGPSWVCWRYGDNHCGWAPLPPGAWFRPGVGLTFHGRQVNGSFGFGLGVRSFAFVDVSHFRDPHLNRHALPAQQAAQVFHTTAASATIVGNNHRVINHGIPVGRVAAATGTDIHQIAIREVNAPAGQGGRGERFEGNSRTMSVVHPHFPASTGAQTAPGGRPRSELHKGGISPAVASTPHGVTRDPTPPAAGGALAIRPNATEHFVPRVERPVTGARGSTTPASGSTRTTATVRSDPPPRSAAPLILHGPDRTAQSTAGSRAGAARETAPRGSLVITGSKESNPQRTPRQTSAWRNETPKSPRTAPSQEATPRPAANQRPQPVMTSDWARPARMEPVRSTPRPIDAPARTTHQWQPAAPIHQAPAPAEAHRSSPAPAFTPQPTRSYSPPPAVSTPRAPAVAARPSYSPPAAPAASAPASHGGSSSDRNRR